MRLSYLWRQPLGSALLVALLLSPAIAKTVTLDDTTSVATTTDDATSTTASTAAVTTTADTSSTESTAAATTTASTAAASSTETSTDTDTTSASAAASSDSSSMPTLSGSSSDSASNTSSTSTTYSYPAPTVPPTANAPYMMKSNLPEGTVFIGVGAGLALIGLVMILWRLMSRCMVNRSTQKIAMAHYSQDDKTLMESRRKSTFYSGGQDSNLSLDALNKGGRHVSMTQKPQAPNSSLFFSPTAGAGMQSVSSRDSSGHLASGYYAAGNAAAAGDKTPMTEVRREGRRPQSTKFTSKYHDSPQSSPELPPSRTRYHDSVTSLDASSRGSRAPSAYLDDLMSIPPLPPPSGHGRDSPDPYRRSYR